MLAAFVLLVAGIAYRTAPGRQVLDWATRDSPEARIDAYVGALARHDNAAALAAWELGPRAFLAQLTARRIQVTADLGRDAPSSYRIVQIQWWRTCCEPGVIERREYAGAARVSVELHVADGTTKRYLFDVLAEDNMPVFDELPARQWKLRDVYRVEEQPIYLRWNERGFIPGPP